MTQILNFQDAQQPTNPVAASAPVSQQTTLDKFTQTIQTAEKRHHDAVRDDIATGFNLAFLYHQASTPEKTQIEQYLDETCKSRDIKNLENTPVESKIIKLIIGDNTSLVAKRSLVIRAAIALNKTNETFLMWYDAEGGLQAIYNKFTADGKPKKIGTRPASNKPKAQGTKPEDPVKRQTLIDNAKKKLESTILCRVDKTALYGKLDQVQEKTESTAIVVRYPDGRFEIKTVIDSPELVNAAYESYGEQNNLA